MLQNCLIVHMPVTTSLAMARYLLLFTFVLTGMLIVTALAKSTPNTRPNIVLLLADDLGYGDLGCYGNDRVATPNIDGLAQDGLRFTRMYSQPVCTPARAAIMTGRYPARFGMVESGSRFQFPVFPRLPVLISHAIPGGLPDSEKPVLSDLLAEHQYQQAFIGKWHLGFGPGGMYLPMNYGFDTFYGIIGTHNPACMQDPQFRVTDADLFLLRLRSYQSKLASITSLLIILWFTGYVAKKSVIAVFLLIFTYLTTERYYLSLLEVSPQSCILMENKTVLEQPYKDQNMTLRTTKRALEILSNYASEDQPFFLFMSYLQVHLPPIVSPSFKSRSGSGSYYDSLVELDWSVGKIIKRLQDLGIYEETLIIFASDNGPEEINPVTRVKLDPALKGSTTYTKPGNTERIALRGGKMDVWEGGIRVPSIVVWQGVITPGTQSRELVDLMDIYPTIREIIKDSSMKDNFDGKSILPILKVSNRTSPHKCLMHYCNDRGVSAVSCNRYKVHYFSCSDEVFDPPLLFDMDEDPGETTPLSIDEHSGVLADIQIEVDLHEASVTPYPSQFTKTPRPWDFICSNPPFCQKSIDENENFEGLLS